MKCDVNLGSVHTICIHRPCSPQAVNTGTLHGAPVSTGRIGKNIALTMLFANTARGHGCSVHSARVHGP